MDPIKRGDNAGDSAYEYSMVWLHGYDHAEDHVNIFKDGDFG